MPFVERPCRRFLFSLSCQIEAKQNHHGIACLSFTFVEKAHGKGMTGHDLGSMYGGGINTMLFAGIQDEELSGFRERIHNWQRLEYGVAVLGITALLVLGHGNCGAVKAAMKA